MLVRSYLKEDEPEVLALWEECGLTRPWNNPRLDIERKLKVQPELFLVGVLDNELIATAMAGYDGHRGWVYYLAVAPEHRNASHGKCLMNKVESLLKEMGCPKINLLIRNSNIGVAEFYGKIGYKKDEAGAFGKRLIPD